VAASVNGGIPMVKLAMSSPVTQALSQWSLELAGTARERAGWRRELRRELQRWQRLLRRAPA
jgi:hypothetical protein